MEKWINNIGTLRLSGAYCIHIFFQSKQSTYAKSENRNKYENAKIMFEIGLNMIILLSQSLIFP